MDETLRGLLDDLEDISTIRLTRFQQAHEAERIVCGVVQLHGNVILEPAIAVLTNWWDKCRPPGAGQIGIADHHTLLALIASVRHFAGGGS